MANGRLNLTRDQLAAFLKDHQSIKQFELLFSTVDEIAPDVFNEISISAGIAGSVANEALSEIRRLADVLELLAMEPKRIDEKEDQIIQTNTEPSRSDKYNRVMLWLSTPI